MIIIGTHIDTKPAAGRFATRVVRSVQAALVGTRICPDEADVALIVSSTKGEDLDLTTPASQVAEMLHCQHAPIVVSNACTSGVCAQIIAARLLQTKQYKAVIVTGCDIVTEFIRSGFEALKALSAKPARPFDAARDGLNLGEAVATLVLATDDCAPEGPNWHYEAGAIHNDANHISGPSRTGEGSYRCLRDVMGGVSANTITMVGLHGTGTVYNDEMESIALHRAGLSNSPAAPSV